MKITSDTLVELDYQLLDSEGQVIETTEEDGPITYLHGYGEILVGLEEALEGQEDGVDLQVELSADQAYGEHNPDGIVAVPRSELPPDAEVVPDDWITVTLADDDTPEGEEEEMEMRVVEIRPDAVYLDANHPLAGQAVTFKLKVVSVRRATPEEVSERQQFLDTECSEDH